MYIVFIVFLQVKQQTEGDFPRLLHRWVTLRAALQSEDGRKQGIYSITW